MSYALSIEAFINLSFQNDCCLLMQSTVLPSPYIASCKGYLCGKLLWEKNIAIPFPCSQLLL